MSFVSSPYAPVECFKWGNFHEFKLRAKTSLISLLAIRPVTCLHNRKWKRQERGISSQKTPTIFTSWSRLLNNDIICGYKITSSSISTSNRVSIKTRPSINLAWQQPVEFAVFLELCRQQLSHNSDLISASANLLFIERTPIGSPTHGADSAITYFDKQTEQRCLNSNNLHDNGQRLLFSISYYK